MSDGISVVITVSVCVWTLFDVLMIHGLKVDALAFCLDMGFVYLRKLLSTFSLVNFGFGCFVSLVHYREIAVEF